MVSLDNRVSREFKDSQPILEALNKLRTDPKSYIPECEKLIAKFEGDLLKEPGKTTLRTKEGPTAVSEAIEYLKRIEPCGALRFNVELAKVARAHISDCGPKGLV